MLAFSASTATYCFASTTYTFSTREGRMKGLNLCKDHLEYTNDTVRSSTTERPCNKAHVLWPHLRLHSAPSGVISTCRMYSCSNHITRAGSIASSVVLGTLCALRQHCAQQLAFSLVSKHTRLRRLSSQLTFPTLHAGSAGSQSHEIFKRCDIATEPSIFVKSEGQLPSTPSREARVLLHAAQK